MFTQGNDSGNRADWLPNENEALRLLERFVFVTTVV